MRAPKLPGRVLTRGAGGPEWGGTLPHEHYGLCWQLWSERGIPELTACAAHCFCPSPWFSLSASLLSVSLHSPNTKLCLSSAEPTALKASVSALREKKLSLCKENLHFTRECSLHWSRNVWIQSNAPSPSGTDSHNIIQDCCVWCVFTHRNTSKSSIKCRGEEKNISPWTFSKGKRALRFTSKGFLTF